MTSPIADLSHLESRSPTASMKEIGDHLGHRSSASTSLYAKVNIKALREVGAFDLGELQ